jgi:hypothetical protein
MSKKIFILSLFFVFFSCENSESVTCILSSTTIQTNSPIVSGGNLNLTSSDASYGATYEWSGPNGFVSTLQNPTISNTTPSMAGEYSLKVKKGICESEIQKVNVDIIPNTISCTPTNNTGVLTDTAFPINLYSSSTNLDGGNFNFIGENSNTSVTIKFSNTSTPLVGLYTIVPNSSSFNSNQVVVSIKRGDVSASITHYARTGSVLLSKDNNNKFYAVFCDVPFYLSTNTSPSLFGTVKFTLN